MARQKLGQHFLCDAGWQEKIARSIRVSRHSHERPETTEKPYCWIEVGAGHRDRAQTPVHNPSRGNALQREPPRRASGDKRVRLPCRADAIFFQAVDRAEAAAGSIPSSTRSRLRPRFTEVARRECAPRNFRGSSVHGFRKTVFRAKAKNTGQ